MRISLNRIQTIETFITGNMAPAEKIVFEAHSLLDRTLAAEVELQRETYRIVTEYSRAELRNELSSIHNDLMNNPAKTTFRQSILSIFQKK